MSVYLSYGVNRDGKYEHIASQCSGITSLTCPFCDAQLVAVRGNLRANHFRHHDAKPCKESLTAIDDIEGWNHFHLNYDAALVDELNALYDEKSRYPNSISITELSSTAIMQRLLNSSLILFNDWGGVYEYTDIGKIVVGSLSPVRFEKWMRSTLQSRMTTLATDIAQGKRHKAFFDIEATRQQSILTSTLYLFEYKLSDDTKLHKIGRTTREVTTRLSETVREIEQNVDQKVTQAKVVRTVDNAGYIEKYLHHRYRKYQTKIAKHTEYFKLEEKEKNIKSEYTKLAKQWTPFTKAERMITTGRWRYEEQRLLASKKGIEKLLLSKGKLSAKEQRKVLFGRPKGTRESDEHYLDKHQDIVTLLKMGISINKAAAMTKKGRRTVIRVKKRMNE